MATHYTERRRDEAVKHRVSNDRCGTLRMKYLSYINNNRFSGLEVACRPLVPKFAGSNPVEAVGFFRTKQPSARLPSEGK